MFLWSFTVIPSHSFTVHSFFNFKAAPTHHLLKFPEACGTSNTPIAMLHVRFSKTTPTLASPTACTATYPPTLGAGHTITLSFASQVEPPSREKMAETLVRAVVLWLPACTSKLTPVDVLEVPTVATVFLQPGSSRAPTSFSVVASQCEPLSLLCAAPTQCAACGLVQCVPRPFGPQSGTVRLHLADRSRSHMMVLLDHTDSENDANA